ncbi:BnaA01g25030D [Brassica napus]|uniref:BnaA01g25030D protein n=1 Tax=Brassica napus TaxID=3708 RepID=A0A078HK94_BRANA|nr:BnaA01g25030D [Brassica napus]
METANTGIFWYLDDCPIPEGLSALKVSQNMRLALSKLNYSGKVFIHAYGDSQKILEDLNHPSGDQTLDFGKASISATKPALVVKDTPSNFDYLGTASIYSPDDESTPLLMLHHSSGDKDGMLGRILVDFMIWAVDNPAPANIILVLGSNMSRRQEEFENALIEVNMLRYNIHFAYPQNATCPSLPSVHIKWLWESLSSGGNPEEEAEEEEEEEEEEKKNED